MLAETTTIRIHVTTKKRLDTFGTVGDTYDDVLKMLMDAKDKEEPKQ